ncbi:MAG TPA: glutamine--fructose-6-phosphate transaminase (isomerizing) [Caulobacterales bacterium]|nr:glutamine--fructose-6-phosphate transaminase (isomerizing) [Caulobacterales bacterium]
MCGIIGILGKATPAAPRLVEALRRLEYRGYDSAGVAVLEAGVIERRRAPGKIVNLDAALAAAPLTGESGIGHTRWATHGAPTENNAHPHKSGGVAIVHNGIIENFRTLRQELEAAGRKFETETDSEVIAQLIAQELESGKKPAQAVSAAIARMHGAYAIAVLFDGMKDLLIGARKGSPLVVGIGQGEMFLGSDAIAVAPFTQRVIYLEEGDMVLLTHKSAEIFDIEGERVTRIEHIVPSGGAGAEKGNFRHFMLKEIYEQPDAIGRTLSLYVDALSERAAPPNADKLDFKAMKRLHIVACGTAYLAGRVAEYWFEKLAGLSVECDIASEFRYRDPATEEGEAALFISQSGETADTLAALRLCKERKLKVYSLVNVTTSSIARESDVFFPTLAGPEIGVASTKAFTAQLSALAALALFAARQRGKIDAKEEARLTRVLFEAPRLIGEAINEDGAILELAHELAACRDVLFIGRGQMYPLALEGALKLKEISYIHAEGYAAGELKHGPIALVDEHTPTVMLAPHDALFDKSFSNLEEVAARGGRVLLISDEAGVDAAHGKPWAEITVPACDPFIAPIIYAAPVQLLAYHVAALKGTDVDQPRNLAKSVTVE